MELVSENTFKFILKNKENSHFMPAIKLESVLRHLREFIGSTAEHLSDAIVAPQLNVIAQTASSFGIEFEVVTDGFDFDEVAPEVIKSIKGLLVDIEILHEDELYDLVYNENKYSPKQLKNFSSLSRVIVNSGYDFIYEFTEGESDVKSRRELTVDNKNNLAKLDNTLIAGEEIHNNTILVDCVIAGVNTNRNGFTILPKSESTVNKHLTIKKDKVITGVFSDFLITDLRNQIRNIPVPSNAQVELEIETRVNYNNKKPVTNKQVIKKVLIVDE